jgi:hypothetical protein
MYKRSYNAERLTEMTEIGTSKNFVRRAESEVEVVQPFQLQPLYYLYYHFCYHTPYLQTQHRLTSSPTSSSPFDRLVESDQELPTPPSLDLLNHDCKLRTHS